MIREVMAWKGLVEGERRRIRVAIFMAVTISSISLAFLQFGFVSISPFDMRICYVMGLLAPIALLALLLGKGAGFLEGLICATAQCVHARLEPLDLVEKYVVLDFPLAFIVLYALLGLAMGILFAVALHKDHSPTRRMVYLALACIPPALMASGGFEGGVRLGTSVAYLSRLDVGSPLAQAILNLSLMVLVVLVADGINRRWYEIRTYMGVRTFMRAYMIAGLTLVFFVSLAACFVTITMLNRNAAHKSMQSELAYILDLSDEMSLKSVVEKYDSEECACVAVAQDKILFSNTSAYPKGQPIKGMLGLPDEVSIREHASRERMFQTLYTHESGRQDLGYACAAKTDDGFLLIEMPFSLVFEQRKEAMVGAGIVALLLVVGTYVLASRLARKAVIGPIDNTNATLEQIVEGDLDVIASEVDSVEFASLSSQINETVDALKGWINEAERRMERELATARAIQESALPKASEAFPQIAEVDLYASMEPAREVGGDFYDFFLIDDQTIGFLIADVSGKGIPAALFMMGAKNEIATCMLSCSSLEEAINQANAHLCEGNDTCTFVTVWAATLNWKTGELTYVNAGHCEPLIRREGAWEWLRGSDGPIMGFADFVSFESQTMHLGDGDQLLLYTDGVSEAMDIERRQYGEDRTFAFVQANATLPPRELDAAIRRDLAEWADGAEQSDDITIVTLHYDSRACFGREEGA